MVIIFLMTQHRYTETTQSGAKEIKFLSRPFSFKSGRDFALECIWSAYTTEKAKGMKQNRTMKNSFQLYINSIGFVLFDRFVWVSLDFRLDSPTEAICKRRFITILYGADQKAIISKTVYKTMQRQLIGLELIDLELMDLELTCTPRRTTVARIRQGLSTLSSMPQPFHRTPLTRGYEIEIRSHVEAPLPVNFSVASSFSWHCL